MVLQTREYVSYQEQQPVEQNYTNTKLFVFNEHMNKKYKKRRKITEAKKKTKKTITATEWLFARIKTSNRENRHSVLVRYC